MNNKFISLLLAFTFAAATLTTANAADYTTSKDKVVSINPFSFMWGDFSAKLEIKKSPNNSISFDVGIWSYYDNWTGFKLGASYKWYIDLFEEKKSSLNGLALGPRVDLAYWSTNYDWGAYAYESYPSLGIGAEVSYKWVFGGGKWAVEPNIKFSFPVMRKKYGFTPQDHGYGVSVGYCF